jgi:hypothetical protein
MYALLQTIQSPFQFDWCSAGLGQYTTGALATTRYNIAPTSNATGGVYVNSVGSSAVGNVYRNQKGTLSYSLVKTGSTTGTITTAPPYTDSVLANTSPTATNYALTITDGGNGQKFLFNNSVAWAGI